jgi:hypothetical protein
MREGIDLSTKLAKSTAAPVIPLLFIGHVACQTTFVEESFAYTLRDCFDLVCSDAIPAAANKTYPQIRAWDRYGDAWSRDRQERASRTICT